MTNPTCPHGMGTPAACLDCMDEGNLPVPKIEREQTDYTFSAQYAGHCAGCDLPVSPGEQVAKTTKERYMHARCAP